jgi:hypothetical protein
MAKVVLAVGIDIPGGNVESVSILSDQSLLDADIVIFQPGIPSAYGASTYLGKRCLDDDTSFRLREAFTHWRRELAAALSAGKIVFLMLSAPDTVYVGTGRKEYSGTGRNARTSRIVETVSSYDAVPTDWQYLSVSGTEMVLAAEARLLAPYWQQFEAISEYRVYLEGDIKLPLIRTKSGNRVVAAMMRKEPGALVALPALHLDSPEFTEVKKENGKEVAYWSKKGQQFGLRLTNTLVGTAEVIAKESSSTPSPEWTHDTQYRTKAEGLLEGEITSVSKKLVKLEEEHRTLKYKLNAAGSLRRLLYEQGKPLEAAVIEALKIMGFTAANLKEGDSEFDAVFQSAEGRFIGEVEGKDNKAVNIDKFSQLERNLNEDFAREGVSEFAKGVLFGNAFRLKRPSDRDPAFTEKCQTAATRLGVALVHTPDLFEPCRYIEESGDVNFAKNCRMAMFNANGLLVVFPVPAAPDKDT